jgi:hypothetical protein
MPTLPRVALFAAAVCTLGAPAPGDARWSAIPI